ncbi:peptidoglycan recognition protein 5 [Cololabis saira]|uniref:peptidoglycan recognition protein 5 n=1 Tax=Cololabis saira TaxID=129043 RepID=UPI002AD5A3EE|nr:peptidoglycan recognition protein 5 [Cololabis saira]
MYPRATTENKEGVLSKTTPTKTNCDKGGYIICLWSVITVNAACRLTEQTVNMISRLQWGAVAPKQKEKLRGQAQRVVIHHTALPSYKDFGECKDHVVSIQRMHMNQRHFDDIGYNFLVSADGTVFEGRGWGVVGAHTKGHNNDSLGIAFMGNFNNDTPREEAILSVKQLLQFGVSQGFLEAHFVLCGHRDLGATECPGENLYAALPQLRGTT